MSFDESTPYTHKSQYLLSVTLTGSNSSSISGNAADNFLRGNTADNTLSGGDGEDTVIYCHDRADYTITRSGNDVEVGGPDGTDTLKAVESIHFKDGTISVSDL